jgi:hypothetical protein
LSKLLIVGDPQGHHSKIALRKYKPEDVWVWEDYSPSIYTINQIHDRINVTSGNDLQELIDKSMHFDVVTGNPPYTNTSSVDSARNAGAGGCAGGLDYKFFEQAQVISSYVSMIIRAKFFPKMGSSFRRRLFKKGGVVSIVALREETFPSISGTPTCWVTWSANHTGSTKIEYLDGTEKNITLTENTCIKLDNPNYVAEVDNNLGHRYMRGTVKQRQLDGKDGKQPVLTSMGGFNGSMEDNVVYVDESVNVDCVKQHGVVMNAVYQSSGARSYKKKYVSANESAQSDTPAIATGPIYVKPFEYGISSSTVILKTSSYEESKRLQEYLMSDKMQEYMFYNRINNANTRELFSTVEDIL